MKINTQSSLLPFALAGALGGALASSAAGCNPESPAVAGHCTEGSECVQAQLQLKSVDKLDILVVVDNSASAHNELELFKSELPRMLSAFVNGNDPDAGQFPPVQSVNLAVLTSDMGLGALDALPARWHSAVPLWGCNENGDDGRFNIYSEEDIQHCDPTRPAFLSFRGGSATVSAIDSVACVPSLGSDGCGFEQPLEAILKSLTPANSDLTFTAGEGHGSSAHSGFLREDSLLVVVVVSDEDDCSIANTGDFFSAVEDSFSVNTFCHLASDQLHPVLRYTQGLKSLRPLKDDVIFAVVAGVPPALIAQQSQNPDSQDAFFKTVLSDPAMKAQLNEVDLTPPAPPAPPAPPGEDAAPPPQMPTKTFRPIEPSCTNQDESRNAIPPRRLVEVAQSFGENGVVGSICDDDFGSGVGNIMRTVAERLRKAGEVE